MKHSWTWLRNNAGRAGALNTLWCGEVALCQHCLCRARRISLAGKAAGFEFLPATLSQLGEHCIQSSLSFRWADAIRQMPKCMKGSSK